MEGKRAGARPVFLLVLTLLATGLGWEVGRGRGRGGGREGWVGPPKYATGRHGAKLQGVAVRTAMLCAL